TQTRLPLAPLYVSTVDSGNLVGHLLTLRPGLTALCDAPILNRRWIEGLRDTLSILLDAVGKELPDTVVQFEKAFALASAAGGVRNRSRHCRHWQCSNTPRTSGT